MRRPLLHNWLGSDDRDPGCDDAFEVMDRYVDGVLRGVEPAPDLAGFVTHLHHCAACREDTEGLVLILGARKHLSSDW